MELYEVQIKIGVGKKESNHNNYVKPPEPISVEVRMACRIESNMAHLRQFPPSKEGVSVKSFDSHCIHQCGILSSYCMTNKRHKYSGKSNDNNDAVGMLPINTNDYLNNTNNNNNTTDSTTIGIDIKPYKVGDTDDHGNNKMEEEDDNFFNNSTSKYNNDNNTTNITNININIDIEPYDAGVGMIDNQNGDYVHSDSIDNSKV